ncbi:MAG: DUF362 domain-containing protein [Candidatus Omnitrophica bacterium]|nr:DUF362 domain-containing protein [Candidatus Omnitrophota bacterium]
MKSKVYFIEVKEEEPLSVISDKVRILSEKSRVLDFIQKDDFIVIKTHFGEEGNTGFVKPEYIKVVIEEILKKGAKAVISDTNTLYRGRRTNSKEHLELAREHGFYKENLRIEIVIPDDTRKENTLDIEINKRFVKIAKIARLFLENNGLIVISHFKGHLMTGFGGALKNVGMGSATRQGKLFQHSDIAPVVYKNKCVGCARCMEVCPGGAIRIVEKKAYINNKKCIGCASCISVCSFSAIDVAWGKGADTIQEKMVEYASTIIKNKKENLAFFNFLIKITKECDCIAKDDPRICPDIGILASFDPVAIDKASFDLVNKVCGRDIFKELHPRCDPQKQLNYAIRLGLGNLNYELIEIS